MHQDIRFCTTSDGVRLAYAVSGEGPPLVMSATWLTHLEHQWRSLAWRPWLDAFSAAATRCCVTTRAAAGCRDRDAADLSFESWVRDFECVVEAAAFGSFDLLALARAARSPSNMPRAIPSGSAISSSTALMRAGACVGPNSRMKSRRARVLLDLTRLGWGQESHALLACLGHRISSRAAASSIMRSWSEQMRQRPRPKRPSSLLQIG